MELHSILAGVVMIQRNILGALKRLSSSFPAVLVTGARQTGKTTAHLTRLFSPDTLMTGAMAGAFFETFVVGEIVKSFTNAGLDAPLYFYRDSDSTEIDLLIESDGTLYPVEIKATSTPKEHDAKNLSRSAHITDKKIARPIIICNTTETGLAKNAITFPVQFV